MLLQSCRWRCSCCSALFFFALTSRFLHRSDAFRHFLRPTARSTTTTITRTAVDFQHFYPQPSRFEAYKSDILYGSVTKLRSSKDPQSGASEVKSSSNIRKTRTVRTWDESFQLLVKYKEKQGDCNVPQKYKQDPILGRWVNRQRNRKDSLQVEQRAKLDDLGFSWTIKRRWDESFHLLVKYQEQYGNCQVPIAYNLDPTLGEWVIRQRQI
jgi:Helicase associated domain